MQPQHCCDTTWTVVLGGRSGFPVCLRRFNITGNNRTIKHNKLHWFLAGLGLMFKLFILHATVQVREGLAASGRDIGVKVLLSAKKIGCPVHMCREFESKTRKKGGEKNPTAVRLIIPLLVVLPRSLCLCRTCTILHFACAQNTKSRWKKKPKARQSAILCPFFTPFFFLFALKFACIAFEWLRPLRSKYELFKPLFRQNLTSLYITLRRQVSACTLNPRTLL